jgi:hypothetical protein
MPVFAEAKMGSGSNVRCNDLLNEAALRQEQDKAILLPLILNTC